MKPRLIILNDSGASPNVLDFDEVQSITIGRAPENVLVLSGSGVSRNHCRIAATESGDFEIEDLGSHNGTQVNNSSVSKTLLRHGDEIVLGELRLRFLTSAAATDNLFSSEIKFIDDAAPDDGLITASIVEGLTVSAKELSALTKLGRALNEIKNSDELQEKLTEIILEIVRADRAAILLLNNDLEVPYRVTVTDKSGRVNAGRPMPISRRITQLVLESKEVVISNNIPQTQFSGTESLISYGINSVLCVPLLLGDITGLIYLDSTDPVFWFEENHLQQITAVASLASSALKNLRHIESLQAEYESLQNFSQIETEMIGTSHSMKTLYSLIAKIAPSESIVLIVGETGTGKELVARAVHKNSQRKTKPFIVVNCALLNENLLESDLFGHEKGAFTGAVNQRKGKLELAEGGTVFMDEIGELPPALQVKLLRFLQEREFERLGGNRVIKANVRIIAATNRNLKEEVKRGNFREDLFFRLNVLEIKTTPLRERREDLPALTKHFIDKYSRQCKRRVDGISTQAAAAMRAYGWRGNVRELENAIERAIVMGTADKIQLEDLPYEMAEKNNVDAESEKDFKALVKEAKRKIILKAIKEANKNYSEAARRLKIHPNNLHRILRELGIKEESRIDSR